MTSTANNEHVIIWNTVLFPIMAATDDYKYYLECRLVFLFPDKIHSHDEDPTLRKPIELYFEVNV